jgi:hypothetical protein
MPREERGVIDTLSSLFYPPRPQIGFSPSEQGVLVHALLNQSDAKIARRLRVVAGRGEEGVAPHLRSRFGRSSEKTPARPRARACTSGRSAADDSARPVNALPRGS